MQIVLESWFCRESALSIFLPVLEDSSDRFGEILFAILDRLTVTTRSRNFRAIPEVPLSVPLDYGGELVVERVP